MTVCYTRSPIDLHCYVNMSRLFTRAFIRQGSDFNTDLSSDDLQGKLFLAAISVHFLHEEVENQPWRFWYWACKMTPAIPKGCNQGLGLPNTVELNTGGWWKEGKAVAITTYHGLAQRVHTVRTADVWF